MFFNLTETANGEIRPLQPQELYRTQQYATAVYRSELAHRLDELGYEIEHGNSGQPEIKGYSREYLDASSPRRKQIEDHLAMENQNGAAAEIAAHHTREAKLELSHEEMQRRHQDMASEFGDQPQRVKAEAKESVYNLSQEEREKNAHSALTFAKERNLERDAVADERALLTDALRRFMGGETLAQVEAEFEERIKSGEFAEAHQERQLAWPGVYNCGDDRLFESGTGPTPRAGDFWHAQGHPRSLRRSHGNQSRGLLHCERSAAQQVVPPDTAVLHRDISRLLTR